MAATKDKLSRSSVIEALQEMMTDASQEEAKAHNDMTRAYEMGRKRSLEYAIKLLT